MTNENSGIKPELSFGYIDEDKYHGKINWSPVEVQYMYGIKLDDVKFNGKSSGICKNRKCLITVDSGSS